MALASLAGLILTLETRFEAVTCCNHRCGFPVMLPATYVARLRNEAGTYWCPACGTSQGWTEDAKDKEIERLKKEATRQKADADHYRKRSAEREEEARRQEARANGYKGQLTLVKRRLANGVCPCCNRYFKELHRHMETKHPEFVGEAGTVAALVAPTVEDFDAAVKKAVEGFAGATQATYRSTMAKLRPLLFPEGGSER